MKTIILALIICLSISCVKTSDKLASDNFQQFDQFFNELEWKDTLDSKNRNWALGYLYEITAPILSPVTLYSVIDTADFQYNIEDRLYAEGKMQLTNGNTAYFISRQYEDITYDRSTFLFIFNKKNEFIQVFLFSEFIGYEGSVSETQSQLFQTKTGDYVITTATETGYFDITAQEMIETKKIIRKQWKNHKFVAEH